MHRGAARLTEEFVVAIIEGAAGGFASRAARMAFTRKEVDEATFGRGTVEAAQPPSAIACEFDHEVVVRTFVGVLGERIIDSGAVELATHELVAQCGRAKLLAAAQAIDEVDSEGPIVEEPNGFEPIELGLSHHGIDLTAAEQLGYLGARLPAPRERVHRDILGATRVGIVSRLGLGDSDGLSFGCRLAHPGKERHGRQRLSRGLDH